MDYLGALSDILNVVLMAVVPYVAALIKSKFDSERDALRAVEYDRIGEGILNIIRVNHPEWDIVEDIDRFKDALVREILADTRSTNNRAIAARVASTAIVKAQNGSD